jgi:C-terminal processing protease CtpA/Prc
VDQIIKVSPAYLAGIRRGDNIVELNLLDTPPQLTETAAKTYDVRWQRGNEEFSDRITATTFKRVDPMELLWLENQIPVFRIGSFANEFYSVRTSNKILKEIVRHSPTAIIIDMRGNEGGDGVNFHHFVSHFNKNFTTSILAASKKDWRAAAQESSSNPAYTDVMSEGFHIPSFRVNPLRSRFKGNIVILVDHLAASAGDLVPQILRETRNAVLIGRKTSGYLLGSEEKILSGGFRLSYPAWEVTPPSATRLEKVGVAPDIELSVQETATDELIYSIAVNEIIRRAALQQKTKLLNSEK